MGDERSRLQLVVRVGGQSHDVYIKIVGLGFPEHDRANWYFISPVQLQ